MKNNNNFGFNAVKAATNPTIGLNTMNTVDCVNTANGFELRSKESAIPNNKVCDIPPIFGDTDYKNLIKTAKLYNNTSNCKLDIASNSIYLQLRRFIYKCSQLDISNFSKSSSSNYQYTPQFSYLYSSPINSLLSDPAMNIINQCIINMIDRTRSNCKDYDIEYDCYGNILHDTIVALFDIYHICDNDNSKRVFEFIDYFIETFKPEK